MVTLLITSVLIAGLFAIAIYLWQKPANTNEPIELPPPNPPRSLFADSESSSELTTSENNNNAIDWQSRLDEGDLSVLLEIKDSDSYSEAVDRAVSNATTEARVLRLASFVATNDLRVNRALAAAIMQSWAAKPDKQSTTKMLHFAALSDDAEVYRNAVEQTLEFWREGKINDITATELLALFNGEFWLLSLPVRSSGTGFVLKRTLSSARRELEGTTNNTIE
jgi:hypothetical protein